MNRQLRLGETILLPATVNCKPEMAAYRVVGKATGGHVQLEAESHYTVPFRRVIRRATKARAKSPAYCEAA